ncbi:glycoside hydrolase family 16 protein [Aeromicrobium stalagmiti]|uniref:glycoside hydrolase family 16 protein n=1 Tax=Aeromicrobium stalagmiti TaxID=2738988 RepID=UPI00156A0DB1|nr:glycoside hydrolase family 16 protein [Aeromicrobium stalagmiti]NRQ49240.1 glycoside hydrolase family 16 protein [Aeromicrobium stalagmiti]
MSKISRLLALSAAAVMLLVSATSPAMAGKSPRKPATKPPAPTCGSQVFYKASGAAWTCRFADEFDGTSLNTSKWVVHQGTVPGGQECFSANNVAVANGVLVLSTRKVSTPVTCGSRTSSFTSGQVSGYGKYSQTYGRFEIRAKFPAAKVAGLHSALWMWPVNPTKYGTWPASGEIDIAEMYTTYPGRVIPYLHYSSQPGDTTVTNNYCMVADVSAFHTYVLEWTTNRLKVMFDGQTCLDHTINAMSPLTVSGPFDQPFFMALTQGLGVGGNSPTSTTPLPADTQVDYVRTWS